MILVKFKIMPIITVKALNGDLYAVDLSPAHQTVGDLVDAVKAVIQLLHPYDIVDILHPSSVA